MSCLWCTYVQVKHPYIQNKNRQHLFNNEMVDTSGEDLFNGCRLQIAKVTKVLQTCPLKTVNMSNTEQIYTPKRLSGKIYVFQTKIQISE